MQKTTQTRNLIAVLLGALAVSADAAVSLDDVTVTASMRAQSSAKTPAFVSIVDSEQIKNFGSGSVGDILARYANVSNQPIAGRDNVHIRGMAEEYTLILVDGVRVSSSGALWRGADFDLSSIPQNSIARIEVLRGAAAAIYGADAIGGVINIITKKPSQVWQSGLQAAYTFLPSAGGKNQYRLAANTSGAMSDALALSLALDYYGKDAWYDEYYNDKIVPASEEKQSFNFASKLKYFIDEQHDISFAFSHNKDRRPYNIYGYRKLKKFYRAQQISRQVYSMQYQGREQNNDLNILLQYDQSKIDDFSTRYSAPQQRELEEQNLYFKIFANQLIGRHRFLYGIDSRQQKVTDPATYTIQDGESKEWALFAQDSIQLLSYLDFLLAARYDHSAQFGGHLSPKAYMVLNANKALNIKLGYSNAFKAPRPHQSTPHYKIESCGGKCFIDANQNLKPETADNYELGFDYRQSGISVAAALFYNDVDQQIASIIKNKPNRTWANLTKVKVSGIELDAGFALGEKWATRLSLTHLFKTDSFDAKGNKNPYMPETVLTTAELGVDYQLNDWWQSALNFSYRGKRYIFGSRDQLKPYHLLAWRNNWALGNDLSLGFGVENIADVRLNDVDKRYDDAILGRNFYLNANYEF